VRVEWAVCDIDAGCSAGTEVSGIFAYNECDERLVIAPEGENAPAPHSKEVIDFLSFHAGSFTTGQTGLSGGGHIAFRLGFDTGGTPDILRHRTTGLLADDADGFARDLRALADNADLRRMLGSAARADVHARFSATTVVGHIEGVYHQVRSRASSVP